MSVVLNRPYKFADRVVVDGVKGTIVESNESGIAVQFVKGKVRLTWPEIYVNPDRVKPA